MSLIKCPECGKENVSDTALACPECGFSIKDYVEHKKKDEKEIVSRANFPDSQIKKKPIGLIILLGIILLLFVSLGVALATSKKEVPEEISEEIPEELAEETTIENVSNIISLDLFTGADTSRVKELLGEPDKINEYTLDGFVQIPYTSYEYNSHDSFGELSVDFVDDKVVRFLSYNDYEYGTINQILEEFNITKSEDIFLIDKNDSFEKYGNASDNIPELWINLINKDSNTFGFIRATYEPKYYEEFYIYMSLEDRVKVSTYTEDIISNFLNCPSTAKYPNLDEWKIGRNDYYTVAKSYVDAQNLLGANVRNEFTVIYSGFTTTPVLIDIDGNVVLNIGYVETEELIKESIKAPKTDSEVDEKPTLKVEVVLPYGYIRSHKDELLEACKECGIDASLDEKSNLMFTADGHKREELIEKYYKSTVTETLVGFTERTGVECKLSEDWTELKIVFGDNATTPSKDDAAELAQVAMDAVCVQCLQGIPQEDINCLYQIEKADGTIVSTDSIGLVFPKETKTETKESNPVQTESVQNEYEEEIVYYNDISAGAEEYNRFESADW